MLVLTLWPAPDGGIGTHLNVNRRRATWFNNDVEFFLTFARLMISWLPTLRRPLRAPLPRSRSAFAMRFFARRALWSRSSLIERHWASIELAHGAEALWRPLPCDWLAQIDDRAHVIVDIFVFIIRRGCSLSRRSFALLRLRAATRPLGTFFFVVHGLSFVVTRRGGNRALSDATLAPTTTTSPSPGHRAISCDSFSLGGARLAHYRRGGRGDHGIFIAVIIIDVALAPNYEWLCLRGRGRPATRATSAATSGSLTATGLRSCSPRTRSLDDSRCRRCDARRFIIIISNRKRNRFMPAWAFRTTLCFIAASATVFGSDEFAQRRCRRRNWLITRCHVLTAAPLTTTASTRNWERLGQFRVHQVAFNFGDAQFHGLARGVCCILDFDEVAIDFSDAGRGVRKANR
jgi:hypothetical protein